MERIVRIEERVRSFGVEGEEKFVLVKNWSCARHCRKRERERERKVLEMI